MASVATDFCKTAFGCDAAESRKVFDDESSCRTEMESFWREDLEFNGSDCADAQLDLHACYATASCADQFSGCIPEKRDVADVCPE